MMKLSIYSLFAQFPPRVDALGSTAIHKDSSIIKAWASNCKLEIGWVNIAQKSLGKVTFGTNDDALSKADAVVVSLGDGGSATMTFSLPIRNGEGPDFAVFENGFDDLFLELATVSVSSNGIDFVNFPPVSNTSTLIQKGTFDTLKASKLYNLAGKYRVYYGTPFDLEELTDSLLINVDRITHVRVTDVIGALDRNFATIDSKGNIINDPYPTPFPSGGFDLDAVAVINQQSMSSYTDNINYRWSIFPNPVLKGQYLTLRNKGLRLSELSHFKLINCTGQSLDIKQVFEENNLRIRTDDLKPGIYTIIVMEKNIDLVNFKFVVI